MLMNPFRFAVQKAPNQVSGMTSWLDFTDTSTLFQNTAGTTPVSANGQPMQSIRDKAPSNTLWTRVNTDNSFVTPGANGTGEVTFGSNTYLESGVALSSFITASAATVVIAIKTDWLRSASSGFVNLGYYDSGGYFGGTAIMANGDMRAGVSGWDGNIDQVTLGMVLPKNDWSIISIQHVGGNLRVRQNRSQWATVASGDTQSLTNPVRMWAMTGAGGVGNRLKHAACYNVAVSDPDLESLENWMATQVGITLPTTQLASAVWDIASSGGNITLSNGNKTATASASASSTIIKSDINLSVDSYWEALVVGNLTPGRTSGIGLCAPASSNVQFIGVSNDAYAWIGPGDGSFEAALMTNNVQNNSANFRYTEYSVLGFLYKVGVGLYLRKDRGAWIGGGDPGLGTSPTWAILPGYPLKLACSPYQNSGPNRFTLRTHPGEFGALSGIPAGVRVGVY